MRNTTAPMTTPLKESNNHSVIVAPSPQAFIGVVMITITPAAATMTPTTETAKAMAEKMKDTMLCS